MCVQVIAQGIISVNGFDRPSITAFNVPTPGRDAVVIRLIKGNGVSV